MGPSCIEAAPNKESCVVSHLESMGAQRVSSLTSSASFTSFKSTSSIQHFHIHGGIFRRSPVLLSLNMRVRQEGRVRCKCECKVNGLLRAICCLVGMQSASYLPTFLPLYLPTFLCTFLCTLLPSCFPTCLPPYLPTILRTFLPFSARVKSGRFKPVCEKRRARQKQTQLRDSLSAASREQAPDAVQDVRTTNG